MNRPQLQQLWNVVQTLNEDECEVLLRVAQGLGHGLNQYGHMQLDKDPRDWVRETLEEVRDGLVYVGAKLVQLERKA